VEIKGTAFLTRRDQAIQMGGEPRWEAFIGQLKKADPYFGQPILGTTMVPSDKWLAFMDAFVDHYFPGDRDRAYWTLGEGSASWALGPKGPYGLLLPKTKDLRALVDKSWPKLYAIYFSSGTVRTQLEGNVAHAWLRGIPMHPYFEILCNAYFKKSMEMLGMGKVTYERVKGSNSPDGEIYYRFTLTPD
jgi:hypothetical protein